MVEQNNIEIQINRGRFWVAILMIMIEIEVYISTTQFYNQMKISLKKMRRQSVELEVLLYRVAPVPNAVECNEQQCTDTDTRGISL